MRHEPVEPGFRAFVARVYGDEGREWIERLPSVLERLCTQWRLQLGPELPGGLLSCVRAVTIEDGTAAVLKVGSRPGTRHEIAALGTWAADGAPALLASDIEQQALLLERIEPGSHPASASAEEVAALLRRLHVEPPASLPALAATVRERIGRALDDGRASEQKAGWALAKVAELERSSSPAVLVHGDFDERNLLECRRRGLCAIDPLPCTGDPAYDAGTWVHGNRRPDRRARLDAVAAATGLDRDRVRDWAAIAGVHG